MVEQGFKYTSDEVKSALRALVTGLHQADVISQAFDLCDILNLKHVCYHERLETNNSKR